MPFYDVNDQGLVDMIEYLPINKEILPDCVLFMPFNDNALDVTPYRNHGTVSGAVLASGKYGKCYSFDGVDDYITNSFILNTALPFTIAVWGKLTDYGGLGTPNQYPGFVRMKTDQATGFAFLLGETGPTYNGVIFGSSDNFVRLKTTTDVSASFVGTWKHAALVYNGAGRTNANNYAVYVDGVSLALSASGAFAATVNSQLIGQCQPTTGYWKGLLEDLIIFKKALSQAQIQQIMNERNPF